MSNLGPYQQITTLAKSLGGVEKLVHHIEAAAVTKAAPRHIAVGVVIGGLLVGGGKVLYDRYRTSQRIDEARNRVQVQADRRAAAGSAPKDRLGEENSAEAPTAVEPSTDTRDQVDG